MDINYKTSAKFQANLNLAQESYQGCGENLVGHTVLNNTYSFKFLDSNFGGRISLYWMDICPVPGNSNELYGIVISGTRNNIDVKYAKPNAVELLADKVTIYRNIVFRLFINHSLHTHKQFCRHSLGALLSEALCVSFLYVPGDGKFHY